MNPFAPSRPRNPNRLRVEPLEDRTAPAVYAVTLLSPAVGDPGETAAAHAGELRVNPALPAHDGEQVIGAATPADAIRSALTGTVSLSISGRSASYSFGRDTAGHSAADHRPYFVEVSGTEGRVWLEDMAGLPDSDWDYNDRSWRVSIRQLSSGSISGDSSSGAGGGMMSPLSSAIDSGQFTWVNQFGETAMADYQVTEYAPDIWLWQYTVTNNDLSTSSPPPRHGVANIDIPAAAGAGVFDVQITGDVSNWHAEPNYPFWYRESVVGSYLAPGQTAVLTFKTPPVPILSVFGAAAVSARIPSLAEGPAKGPGKPPTVTAQLDPIIPVNANNDNYNPSGTAPKWKSDDQKFIPAIRDFDADHLWQDDLELRPMKVTITGGYSGTLWVEANTTGAGRVAFWKDKKKESEFVSEQIAAGQNPVTRTIYVEGTHESSAIGDVEIRVGFTIDTIAPIGGGITVIGTGDEGPFTVAPLINSTDVSVAPNPNVTFRNGQNGAEGIQAKNPAAAQPAGIIFKADVAYTFDQEVRYLQNLNDAINGQHGNFGHGVTYSNRPLEDLVPDWSNDASFPILDAGEDAHSDPTYSSDPLTLPSNVPYSAIFVEDDSPLFVFGNNVQEFDIEYRFTMYLVIRYFDGSIYPIAYVDWGVIFRATSWVDGVGMTAIDPVSKVFANAATFTPSNADPEKTVPPTVNDGGLIWIPIT